MQIRMQFTTILLIIAAALGFCAHTAFKSPKTIGRAVGWLELGLIPPVIGNIIIICSGYKTLSAVGCYIYFIGMNLLMYTLVNFTNEYCSGFGQSYRKPTAVYVALMADTVQILLNIFTGHAFGFECVEVEGLPYYRFVTRTGLTVHRCVDYGILVCVMLIFILAAAKTVKINRERYTVILVTLFVSAGWQAFYMLSRMPIDSSMIGFGILGLLVFYFALYYRSLRLLDQMLSDIAADLTYALYVFDSSGKCIWANEKGLQLAGLSDNEKDRVSEKLAHIIGDSPRDSADWHENKVIGSGEDAVYYSVASRSVTESKRLSGSFLIIRDTTDEQRRIKEELYNSTHDGLTGLYTKQHLYRSIRLKLDGDPNTDYKAVFIDVQNFKIVNDIFGTGFGDAALMQIADTLRSVMTADCVYGRLAGDTFGAFIPADSIEAQEVENILSNFTVRYSNIVHRLPIHIGIYEVTDRDTDVSVMFDRAHLSLSTITNEYNTHIAYYDNDLRDKVMWEQSISAGLSEAIASMQLLPYLQPITDKSGRVVGAEALARWIHPERGFMPPATFIPVFERNGMIVEVDKHMWRCACKVLESWKGVHDDLFISVNISPKDFYFTDVVSEITSLVEQHGLEPSKLRIEITETVMMTDPEEKMKLIGELRSKGFIVEMDDFGSGYSSLSLLKDMPVDVLKIDMKFLSSSGSPEKANMIVKNIIRLSEELGIASLTEGVETREQYSQLAEMGCKMFQGYFFAKPMPVGEFEEFTFGGSVQS